MEDGKIKEFNCYASLNIMLAQLGVQPDFASAVEAQAAKKLGNEDEARFRWGKNRQW